MAPGPATDHIVYSPFAAPGISKAALLALAQNRNLSAGRCANAGLEAFLPPPRLAERKPISPPLPSKRKGGFKPVSTSSACSHIRGDRRKQKIRKTVSGAATPFLAESSNIHSVSFADFRQFRHSVQQKVRSNIEKLTKRLILSKEDNIVRATTMATVQIAAKARHHRIFDVFARSNVPSQGGSPSRRPSFLRGEMLAGLQAAVVDKLAVSEIHSRKRDQQRAAFPKLTNAQIQAKLSRLRVSAQEAFKPLKATQSLEVLRLSDSYAQ